MPHPKRRSRIAFVGTTLASGAQLLTARNGLAHAAHNEAEHSE